MNDARSLRTLSVIILLIILLHLLITWNIFYKPFEFFSNKINDPLLQKQHQHTTLPQNQPERDWAALRGGGAPVVLQQSSSAEPEDQTPEQSQDVTDAPPGNEPEQKSIPQPEAPLLERQEVIDNAPPIESQKKDLSETTLRNNKPVEKQSDASEKIGTDPEINKTKKPNPQQKDSEAKATQEKPKTVIQEPHKEEKKKIMPFSQMLKGMSDQWDNGNDPYTMHGKKDGKATADQLKHGNYRNKIARCIQTGILTNRTRAVIRKDGIYSLTVNMVIAPNGSLHHLSIKESSKVPTLDLFIIRAIQDAASSFPPVPPSFGKDAYPMPIHFENVVAIIEHPEHLQWIL